MSEYSDELGAWWSEIPGSDRATWLTAAPGAPVPARDGVRGAMSRRALRHGLVVPPGKRERAKREKTAQWRRQTVAGIREPSLKSGVITVGSGFGGTGLFAKLQVGTLLHGDKYVFVTEASQLGFWSINQVFSRYRNYEGEKERPLTEQEMRHLNGLMDEATIVVDKFTASDPEQAR